MENIKSRREFIAKQIADLGKAALTVGVASYFFKGFPTFMRVGITFVSVVLLIGSFFIYPTKRGE
jgi:membrane protein YdbS with pleckstrin-like domain